MADNSTPEPSEQTEEKQSTKTFTQSEYDMRVARERQKLEDKYSDYDTLKQTTQELLEFKKQAEMEKLTDTEKAQKTITELTTQLEQTAQQNSELNKRIIKNDILSRSEFAKLPRAYKSLVSASESEEAVIQSAQSVLEEWRNDFGIKDQKTTIGESEVVSGAQPAAPGASGDVSPTWRESFKEKLLNRN
jgi:hypothetical protein